MTKMLSTLAEKLTFQSGSSVFVLVASTIAVLGLLDFMVKTMAASFTPSPKYPGVFMMPPDAVLIKAPWLFQTYTSFEIHQALVTGYGEKARELYVILRAIDHVLVPLMYTAALLSLNAYLVPKGKGLLYGFMRVLPLLGLLTDISENCAFVYLYMVFEEGDTGSPSSQRVATASFVLQLYKVSSGIIKSPWFRLHFF